MPIGPSRKVVLYFAGSGPWPTARNLDAGGRAAACLPVERAAACCVDVAVISKFGKQEAACGGPADAFKGSFSRGTPLLTAVSPAVAEAREA